MYNVPGRTGGDGILPATAIRLSKLPSVVAIKEASGKLGNVSEIKRSCQLIVLSGDDALTLPIMSLGGMGVVSVLSNWSVKMMCDVVHKALG